MWVQSPPPLQDCLRAWAGKASCESNVTRPKVLRESETDNHSGLITHEILGSTPIFATNNFSDEVERSSSIDVQMYKVNLWPQEDLKLLKIEEQHTAPSRG